MSKKEPLLTDVPIVSAEHLRSDNLRIRAAAQVLLDYGLRDIGFVFLKVNWSRPYLLSQAYGHYRDFFRDEYGNKHKKALHRPDLFHQRGWTPPLTERAIDAPSADRKECLFFGPELPTDHPYKKEFPIHYHNNLWPGEKYFPGFRRTTLEIYNELSAMADTIVMTLEQHFGLPRFSWQPDLIKDAPSTMRVLYYPRARLGTEMIWGGAHKDLNLITLLPPATRNGLFAKRRDGEWMAINCPKNCVVVQCGNMLEYLTGGEYLSAEHEIRAQIGTDPRLAIAYFAHVKPEIILEPLPRFMNDEVRKKYPPIRAIDFTNKRLEDIKLAKKY